MRHVTGSSTIDGVMPRSEWWGNPECPQLNAGSSLAHMSRHIKRGPARGLKAFRPPRTVGS
ncbi:MAG: hypothetical protein ACFFCO_05675 [Promethearchaeota archaeon]